MANYRNLVNHIIKIFDVHSKISRDTLIDGFSSTIQTLIPERVYAGELDSKSNAPNAYDGNVFFIALEGGDYSSINLSIPNDGIYIVYNDANDNWGYKKIFDYSRLDDYIKAQMHSVLDEYVRQLDVMLRKRQAIMLVECTKCATPMIEINTVSKKLIKQEGVLDIITSWPAKRDIIQSKNTKAYETPFIGGKDDSPYDKYLMYNGMTGQFFVGSYTAEFSSPRETPPAENFILGTIRLDSFNPQTNIMGRISIDGWEYLNGCRMDRQNLTRLHPILLIDTTQEYTWQKNFDKTYSFFFDHTKGEVTIYREYRVMDAFNDGSVVFESKEGITQKERVKKMICTNGDFLNEGLWYICIVIGEDIIYGLNIIHEDDFALFYQMKANTLVLGSYIFNKESWEKGIPKFQGGAFNTNWRLRYGKGRSVATIVVDRNFNILPDEGPIVTIPDTPPTPDNDIHRALRAQPTDTEPIAIFAQFIPSPVAYANVRLGDDDSSPALTDDSPVPTNTDKDGIMYEFRCFIYYKYATYIERILLGMAAPVLKDSNKPVPHKYVNDFVLQSTTTYQDALGYKVNIANKLLEYPNPIEKDSTYNLTIETFIEGNKIIVKKDGIIKLNIEDDAKIITARARAYLFQKDVDSKPYTCNTYLEFLTDIPYPIEGGAYLSITSKKPFPAFYPASMTDVLETDEIKSIKVKEPGEGGFFMKDVVKTGWYYSVSIPYDLELLPNSVDTDAKIDVTFYYQKPKDTIISKDGLFDPASKATKTIVIKDLPIEFTLIDESKPLPPKPEVDD